MALQTLANAKGILLGPMESFGFTTQTGNLTLDAAGESAAIVGYINLSSGPGTSKTLSAAGSGKIHWLSGAVTFANGSTNVRVGVNDVGATGLEDGTHDVYGDLTGGGGGISASAVNTTTMGTGSKSITHGDLVAIVVEMTARGGADSVVVVRSSPPGTVATPHGTADTGSGPAKTGNGAALAVIEFDDGTVGWLDNHIPYVRGSSATFNSGSTPDEHALVFQVPFRAQAMGLYALVTALASTDDFELILYSDPLGTPVAERTITQDMDLADVGTIVSRPFTSAYTLEVNTNYAVALRPTTANALSYQQMSLGSGGANIRKAVALGTNFSLYTRTNQSGAFGSQSTIILPCFGVWLSALSDDASSGGGVNLAARGSGVGSLG